MNQLIEYNNEHIDNLQIRKRTEKLSSISNSDNNPNPIIQVAGPILAFMSHIKKSDQPEKINQIREKIINEITLFDKKLGQLGYQNKTVLAVRYCLCTALDESVLNTDWGTNTLWVQHTLLGYFHNETWGGERFYIIVDTLAQKPRQNIAAIEFLYTLMTLGFQGKLYSKEAEPLREEIRHRTLSLIKNINGKQSRQLANHTIDSTIMFINQQKTKSLKVISGITAALIITVIAFTNVELNKLSSITITKLQSIATTPALANYTVLQNRPVLHKNKGTEK